MTLEWLYYLFTWRKAVNKGKKNTPDEDESMDVSCNSQSLQADNFLDNVYTKSFSLEVEMSSVEMQVTATKNYL